MARPRGVKPEIQYTDEQSVIIDASKTGTDGIAEALAGCGKTTVLNGVCLARPKSQFLYAAFNRKVADEAKRTFARNATCRTLHSIAFGTVGVNFKHKLAMPRQRYDEIGRIIGVSGALQIGENSFIRNWQVVAKVIETVKFYCQSADELPTAEHVQLIKNADPDYWAGVAETIVGYAHKMWADIINRDGKISWYKNHDYYLKMWALTHPRLPYDCLLVDEAQDSNPVTLAVVMEQECQKILVGDQYQQLYAWRGAVDAMASFEAEWREALTQTFRFGQAIAAEGNKFLELLGADNRIVGFDQINSEIMELDNPKTILCRTNAQVVAEALQIMEKGNTHGVVGGTDEIMRFARAVADLQRGQETAHPDLIGFKNWGEVKEYVENEGSDLRVLVDMVDRYGVGAIIQVAETAVEDEYADTLLSTAHKAKGMEWRSVRIAGDFKEPVDPDTGERKPVGECMPEFMLLYVAATRAKQKLDPSAVSWVNDWLGIGLSEPRPPESPADERVLQRARRRKRKQRDTPITSGQTVDHFLN